MRTRTATILCGCGRDECLEELEIAQRDLTVIQANDRLVLLAPDCEAPLPEGARERARCDYWRLVELERARVNTKLEAWTQPMALPGADSDGHWYSRARSKPKAVTMSPSRRPRSA